MYRRPPPSGNIGRVSSPDFSSGRRDLCTQAIISPAFAKLTENWVNYCSNKTRPVLLHTVYSHLADTLLLTDTPLMRTRASPPPPAKCIKKWLEQTPIPLLRTLAITEMPTLSCPQARDFTCFFSRYSGHLNTSSKIRTHWLVWHIISAYIQGKTTGLSSEPARLSCDYCQRMSDFDSCQFILIRMADKVLISPRCDIWYQLTWIVCTGGRTLRHNQIF